MGAALGGLFRSSSSGPVDAVLAAVIIALIGFGVVMVYSASAIEATVRYHDAQFFLKRQAVYAGLSLVAMWIASRIDYRRLKPLTYPILIVVTLMLLACVVGFGHKAGTLFMSYLQVKEQLAAQHQGGTLNVLGIGAIP